jgi:hypothetical protein
MSLSKIQTKKEILMLTITAWIETSGNGMMIESCLFNEQEPHQPMETCLARFLVRVKDRYSIYDIKRIEIQYMDSSKPRWNDE